jgi:hypothetical protein
LIYASVAGFAKRNARFLMNLPFIALILENHGLLNEGYARIPSIILTAAIWRMRPLQAANLMGGLYRKVEAAILLAMENQIRTLFGRVVLKWH